MSKKWGFLVVMVVMVLASLACNFSTSTAKISEVQMAKDSEGTQPTSAFSAGDTFYCNVKLVNAPDDTIVKAVWTAVEVKDNESNLKLDESSLTHGDGVLNFKLTNSNPWPSGKYKVELYLNDKLNKTVEFTVE
jgi:hypothetical protein